MKIMRRKDKNTFVRYLHIMAIVMFLATLFFGYAFAQQGKAKEQVQPQEKKILNTEQNELSGVISGITKGSVSLVYEQDKKKDIEYEAVFPIDKNIQFEHVKSLSDLKIGDEVKIRFEDTNFEYPDKSQKLQRKAKVISFIKAAAPVVTSETLTSGPQE